MIKFTLVIAITIGFTQLGSAQIKAVNSAEYALMSGSVEDLVIAKEEIDKARLNPKTAEMPKMYLVRADVYSRISGAKKNPNLIELSDKSGLEAMNSMNSFFSSTMAKKPEDLENAPGMAANSFAAGFNEANQLLTSISGDTAKVQSSTRYDQICTYYASMLPLYDKLDTAMTNNLANNKITKKSLMETYAGLATLHSDKNTKIKILQGLIDQGSILPAVVDGLSKSYLMAGDTAKAESCIRNALSSSNNDGALFQILVNHFVSIQQENKLFADVDRQIGIEPTTRLYYTRAFLYESKGNYDSAIADYKEAIQLDEFNYDANFNLGLALMKFETRKIYDKRVGSSGAKRKLYDQELIMLFADSKKYLERALDNVDYSEKDQINICKALKSACLELNDQDGVAKYTSLIKSMEEGGK